MAKTILKPGKYQVITCADCGCEFTFENVDLDDNNKVTCPCCGTLCQATVKPTTKAK